MDIPSPKLPTLYEWVGGSDPFERLIDIFYDLAAKDDVLAIFFKHIPPGHMHLVALWFIEVFGGPKEYSKMFGALKAHPHMIQKHQGMHITEQQRARWVQVMLQAADIAKLPDDPEFRSAFVAYIEWGTRMARMFSGDVPAPKESPMPTWGWGETPPYISSKL